MTPEQAKAKIAKLMKLADPTRGAAQNEAETALRQAQKLMEKFGIDLSQIDPDAPMKAQFVWDVGFYPFASGEKFVKKNPEWFQWLASGVAIFTDTICLARLDVHLGAGVVFKGTDQDVAFALWLISYLKDCIRQGTREAKVGSPAAREAFRKAMAYTLSSRMQVLRQNRNQVFESSKALVVVDSKLAARNSEFGQPNYRTSRADPFTGSQVDASMKGYAAGEKIQFNRPVERRS